MPDNFDTYKYRIQETLDEAITRLSGDRAEELLDTVEKMIIECKKDITFDYFG